MTEFFTKDFIFISEQGNEVSNITEACYLLITSGKGLETVTDILYDTCGCSCGVDDTGLYVVTDNCHRFKRIMHHADAIEFAKTILKYSKY
jgi:hypothetical protein